MNQNELDDLYILLTEAEDLINDLELIKDTLDSFISCKDDILRYKNKIGDMLGY